MNKIRWDEYTPQVSRRSNRWSVTARGWCIMDWLRHREPAGNYLDYRGTATHGPQGETIHAVLTGVVGGWWFATVEEAKTFIEQHAQTMIQDREKLQTISEVYCVECGAEKELECICDDLNHDSYPCSPSNEA